MPLDIKLLLSLHISLTHLALVRDICSVPQDRYAKRRTLLSLLRWRKCFSELDLIVVIFISLYVQMLMSRVPIVCFLPQRLLCAVTRVWLFLN